MAYSWALLYSFSPGTLFCSILPCENVTRSNHLSIPWYIRSFKKIAPFCRAKVSFYSFFFAVYTEHTTLEMSNERRVRHESTENAHQAPYSYRK